MRRGRGIIGAALSLSVPLAGCIGHLPPCPAAGGPAWTELQGAHFRLRTDLDPQEARAVLADLEQFQAALLGVFGAPPDLDIGRLPVVVVDHGWTDLERREIEGYFTHALFQPLVVMRSGGSLASQVVIKHELVHYVSGKVMPRQPLWLSEGLATYYETMECDARAGKVTIGRPSRALLRTAGRTGAASIEAMFGAKTKGEGYDESRFYAMAWITVHYLMNHRTEALQRYERALHDQATYEAAWAAAFGSETPAQIAADVARYVDGGQYALRIYDMQSARPNAPTERRLTDADAHATRALLYLAGQHWRALRMVPSEGSDERLAAGKHEVDEARRQEPDHVLAGAIAHFLFDATVDLTQATRATKTHGDDWMAWFLLAEACHETGDGPCAEAALKRTVETAATEGSVSLPIALFSKPLIGAEGQRGANRRSSATSNPSRPGL